MLDGPNLYFSQAATKLTLNVTALTEVGTDVAGGLAKRIGLSTLRPGEAGSGDERVVHLEHLDAVERPRVVEGARVVQAGGRVAEQRPPSGEEVVERAELVGRVLLTDAHDRAAGGPAGAGPAASGGVGDRVAVVGDAQLRPEVRDAIGGASGDHRAQPGCVEGEEPDATLAVRAAHVGAHVRLREP